MNTGFGNGDPTDAKHDKVRLNNLRLERYEDNGEGKRLGRRLMCSIEAAFGLDADDLFDYRIA